MKKLLLALLLLAGIAFGQDTTTTTLGLTKPAHLSHTGDWDALVNTNMDIIDGTMPTSACALVAWDGINHKFTCVTLANRTAVFSDISPATADSGMILVLDPPTAVHLKRMYCAVQGSTNVVVNLDKRAEATIGTDSGAHLLGSDLTAVAGGANTSTFSNTPCGGTSSCAIAAHVPVMATITSISGSPTSLHCSVEYSVD